MKLNAQQVRLLGLSRTEIRVLDALRAGSNTPVLISEHTNVSRPAIYEILERLHTRGLVTSHVRSGKRYWLQANMHHIESELYETKKALFDMKEGVEEIRSPSDSMVAIHRGGDAIRTLLRGILKDNKNQRLYAIQGDTVVIGWNKVFGVEGTNELNRLIKQNHIIVEVVVPHGWFERQTRLLGKKWARDFEGRMSVAHSIDERYFEHGGQVWIFKNSLYLVAMNEEIIIEVRNSEIQRLIMSMFRFIQENSHKFDINSLLRELIARTKDGD